MIYLTGYTAIQYFFNFPAQTKDIAELSYRAFLDGNFRVEEYLKSSRNITLKVKFGGAASERNFFLKQQKKPQYKDSLKNEAAFYQLGHVPLVFDLTHDLFFYDVKNQIIIFDNAEDYQAITNKMLEDKPFFAKMGVLLAKLHASFVIDDKVKATFHRYRPILNDSGRLALEAERLNALPSKALRDLAAELVNRKESLTGSIAWLSHDTILHGDFRPGNFIIADTSRKLRLIDWEMACIGDRCWDIACMVSLFLDEAHFKGGGNALGLSPKMIFVRMQVFLESYFEQAGHEAGLKEDFFAKVLKLSAICSITKLIHVLENEIEEEGKGTAYRLKMAFELLEYTGLYAKYLLTY